MSFDIKNIRGGGLHYVADVSSTETKLFRGGLRHYAEHNERLVTGTRDRPSSYHDKIDYERGVVIHSRSSANQYFNFHFLYGGFKKYFIDRWLIGHYYRRNLRIMWLPAFMYYTFCCYHMRKYDNAAHDFFYFSD